MVCGSYISFSAHTAHASSQLGSLTLGSRVGAGPSEAGPAAVRPVESAEASASG